MAITVEINGKTYTFRNLEEQVLFLTKELTKVQQSLGSALPDPIEGPQGPQGETGPQGSEGPRGTGMFGCSSVLPSPTAFKEGDFYVLFSGDLYKKINGSWILQTNLKGPQGSIGPQGGTQVIANPVGAATDDLEKLNIDGTIYEVLSTVDRQKLGLVTYLGDVPYVASALSYTAKQTFMAGAGFIGNVDFSLASKLTFTSLSQLKDASNNPIVICENLKDSHGNARFVEGTCKIENGFSGTITYNKWSLSGTHLMIVIAGTINAGPVNSYMFSLGPDEIPSWILAKITPVSSVYIDFMDLKLYDDWQSADFSLEIKKDGPVVIGPSHAQTVDVNRKFRLELDFLIDME